LGYGLLVISLLFDGLMALKEKIINHEVHHNPEHSKYKNRLSWEYMWGLGIGDWAQSPIPNPQSPIPINLLNEK
jgi:hypothetical protein